MCISSSIVAEILMFFTILVDSMTINYELPYLTFSGLLRGKYCDTEIITQYKSSLLNKIVDNLVDHAV